MTDKYTPPIYEKYDTPAQAAKDVSLTIAERLALLETWAEDARSLVEASNEGMPPRGDDAEPPLLSKIEAAILNLKEAGQ